MFDKIKGDLLESMKSGDKFKLGVLRMLKSALQMEQISLNHELNDDEVLTVIRREVKKRNSSITEYEKFNKKYDVYVQKTQIDAVGQIEARYLFNTVFMDRFMQLHTSFRIRKMKCSICENYMLILLATNRDLFEINPIFGRIDDINQYKKLFDEISSVLLFLDVLNPSLSSKTGL